MKRPADDSDLSEESETPPKLTKHHDRSYLVERNEIIDHNKQSDMVSNGGENGGEKCDVRSNQTGQNSQKPAKIVPRDIENIETKTNENDNGSDLPKETGGLSLADEIVKELNDVKSLFEKKRTDSTVKKVRS